MDLGRSGMPIRQWRMFRYSLRMGKTQVIDADISKYFDTIPHDKLLALVAQRVVDKNILRLDQVMVEGANSRRRRGWEEEDQG